MKYKDYVEKHKDILDCIDETLVQVPILVLLESVLEEYPSGEFITKILKDIHQEKERLFENEVNAPDFCEPRDFIAFDKTRKDSDGKEDFDLVYIHKDCYPCCKKHGAMNKVNSTLWRCLSEYGHVKQEGETMSKFKDRLCNACCVEPKGI